MTAFEVFGWSWLAMTAVFAGVFLSTTPIDSVGAVVLGGSMGLFCAGTVAIEYVGES